MEKWSGKVALITGASSGIGSAVAIDFVRNNIITIGLARRVERIEQLKNQLPPDQEKNLHAFKGDITDEKSVKECFKWIEKEFGGVNILVNNAGKSSVRMILSNVDDDNGATETNNDDIREIIGTNFFGMIYATREAYRQLHRNDADGYIINISSYLGHAIPCIPMMPPPHNVYVASKHAVTSTGEVLRQELINLRNKKVRVTSISPGIVDTEIFDKSGLPADFVVRNNVPALEPADISQAILYVLSTPAHVQVKDIIIKPVGESV